MGTNGKPDVVMVQFAANADMGTVDSVVGAANKAISAATTKHVGILSTTNAQDIADATWVAFRYEDIYTQGTVAFGSGAVFTGILALSAYCCLMSLQTPQMFEGDQKDDMRR